MVCFALDRWKLLIAVTCMYSRSRRAAQLIPNVAHFGASGSNEIRDGTTTMRGYVRDDLEPVWARYLSPHPPTNTEHGTSQVAPTRNVPCSDFSAGRGEANS